MACIRVTVDPIQSNFLARTTAPECSKNEIALGWAVDEAVTSGDMTKLIEVRNQIGKQ